eukprot:TRINITY_DN6088_c0_g1_i2.p1 TRINITY_DN6088_c0_g1~~TRINITY_DN6088_c0_g1_i2.p1  ORF type:complete len:676 (-),score=217.23 TRINITY_DN6088_c0_g1_i2:24-2051(-)
MKMIRTAAVAAAVPVALSTEVVESPVEKVVTFIKSLKSEVTAEKDAEKAAFDKYDEWCVKVIDDTTKSIAKAKQTIADQEALINSNSGSGAASGAQIEYLKKQIADAEKNKEEATTTRAKERKAFEKGEEEMKLGIKQLKGMETELGGKKEGDSFLSLKGKGKNIQRVLRSVLKLPKIVSKMSTEQLSSLKNFASGEVALLQESSEPAGNLDAVVNMVRETREDQEKDLKTATDEEKDKIAANTKYVDTLTDELKELRDNLATMEASKGTSQKDLADAKTLLAQTESELAADTKLQTETDDGCKEKTRWYDKRTKKREEELAGIDKAIEILTSDESKATFAASAKVSLLQTESLSEQELQVRQKAYQSLKDVASQYHDYKMARLAMKVKNSAHFDKVIDMIDRQIKDLRAEGEQDVAHRDKCQKQQAENSALLQKLSHTIGKATTKLDRLDAKKTELETSHKSTSDDLATTKSDIVELEADRKKERDTHLAALKEDKDALAIMKQAIVAISEFFKVNKVKTGLLQAPVDPGDKPPTFENKKYEGAGKQTGSLLGLMKMVEDDMANEIEDGKAKDAKDQEIFEKTLTTLKEKRDSQNKEKISLEKRIADVSEQISTKDASKTNTEGEKSAATEEKTVLDKNCKWVTTQFEKRRGKREAEISGLTDAKGFLGAGNAR